MPLFSTGDPCAKCGHSVRFHKKWSPNGALDERCEQRAIYREKLTGRLAIGRCTCPGYVPPKVDHSQLRCVICHRSINKFHEINKQGIRRCENCGTLFGEEWAHPDIQNEKRK
jgi:hypothetical protein